MAGQKRPYNDYGGHGLPQTPPNASASRGYAPSRASSAPRPPKSARTSYHSQSAPGSSQYDPLIVDDEDDEDDASQEVHDSSQGFDETDMSFVLYGFISTKIVGVRYYNGQATVNEIAVPRREPHNQYDSECPAPSARTPAICIADAPLGNAIQILNVNLAQIGHIPRTQAAKLAPFMDRRSLIVEATITGPKEYFECPLTLRIYGPSDPNTRQMLIDDMRSAGLPTSSWKEATQRQKDDKAREKIAVQAAKRAKKQNGAVVGVGRCQQHDNGLAEYAAGSSQGFGPGPSLEDIIGGSERFNPRNVEQIVEEYGIKESDLVSCPYSESYDILIALGRNAKSYPARSTFYRAT
jgi:SWI/SNF-related matrix-associated actin-dependent regulator of chromatin subfamily A3